jgi:hypothetical protein
MMTMKSSSLFLLIVTFLVQAHAQIKVVPIQGVTHSKKNNAYSTQNYRITAEKLVLPLWEDFSTYEGQPDTTLWINSANVWVNHGMCINCPSINVATFDGLDKNGNPYSLDPSDIGLTDSLVSKPIDLTQVAFAKRNSVYLSFYYQKGGQGEPPDAQDMIELQFRTAGNRWARAWPADPESLNSLTSIFNGVSIQIVDSLFHDNFQFRFLSTGRKTGSFDVWNIDYIYLDKNRSQDDYEILDRAITSIPNSIFINYTAIPLRQLYFGDQSIIDSTEVRLFNYEVSEPVQGIEYSAILKNTKTQLEIEKIIDKKAHIIMANNFLDLKAGKPTLQLLKDQVSGPDDSLFLELIYYVDTGDTLLIDEINTTTNDTTYISYIDLRVNDTITRKFTLHNYLAYDDGTAEFGAGINQNQGQIAYKFFIQQPDTLVAFNINFPNINGNVAGLPIDLIVWSHLDGFADSELYRQPFTIQANGINELKTYELLKPLAVEDTFYIGFQQSTNEFIPVGLDKNSDSGENIFYNVNGVWQANTELIGSLMMRPVFGKGGVITPINSEIPGINIYPNPTDGNFTVTGNPAEVNIYDFSGRKMKATFIATSSGVAVSAIGYKQGIYLVEVITPSQRIIQKLIFR